MSYRLIWNRHLAARDKPIGLVFSAENTMLDVIGATVGIKRSIWESPMDAEVIQSDFHYRQDIVDRVLDLTWRTAKQDNLSLETIAKFAGVTVVFDNSPEMVNTREKIILVCNDWKKPFTVAQRSERATKLEFERHATLRLARYAVRTFVESVPCFELPVVCRTCGIVHSGRCKMLIR